jgi:hypothetical protein
MAYNQNWLKVSNIEIKKINLSNGLGTTDEAGLGVH